MKKEISKNVLDLDLFQQLLEVELIEPSRPAQPGEKKLKKMSELEKRLYSLIQKKRHEIEMIKEELDKLLNEAVLIQWRKLEKGLFSNHRKKIIEMEGSRVKLIAEVSVLFGLLSLSFQASFKDSLSGEAISIRTHVCQGYLASWAKSNICYPQDSLHERVCLYLESEDLKK